MFRKTEDHRWQTNDTSQRKLSSKLRQVEVLVGQGTARVDAIRKVGITEQTYYLYGRLSLCKGC